MAYQRAVELHGAAQKAYASIGVSDVEEKRQVGEPTAVAWGCEIQGVRGRAGASRARRAALTALTVALCEFGVTTIELLQRVVGLWVDVLLYRRAAFAVLRIMYQGSASSNARRRRQSSASCGAIVCGRVPGMATLTPCCATA